MKYWVSGTERIHLNETDPVASVLQNIAIILSTPKGSIPMYRDFGLDQTFLDAPESVAQVRMIAPIREAIEQWEPRAKVGTITFRSEEGRLVPCVEVELVEQP